MAVELRKTRSKHFPLCKTSVCPHDAFGNASHFVRLYFFSFQLKGGTIFSSYRNTNIFFCSVSITLKLTLQLFSLHIMHKYIFMFSQLNSRALIGSWPSSPSTGQEEMALCAVVDIIQVVWIVIMQDFCRILPFLKKSHGA